MAGLFKRFFQAFQHEPDAPAQGVDTLVRQIEQEIVAMKQELRQAMESLTPVKTQALRLRKEWDDHRQRGEHLEQQAALLLREARAGRRDPADADRLAADALARKADADARAAHVRGRYDAQQRQAAELQAQVDRLRDGVASYENELLTLQARAKTARSAQKINRRLANADAAASVALLERMREQVEAEESLAEAFGDMAAPETSPDPAGTSLDELKRRMGLT